MTKTKGALTSVLLTFAITASAAKGDEIWKNITNWGDYCPHSEMGDLKGMVLYDIDADGINECIILGEDGNAILTCGDGKGGYSNVNIKVAINSIPSTTLLITKNKPYAIHEGSCGAGCNLKQYFLFEKSRVKVGYQLVETVNPAIEDAETEWSYEILTPEQDPNTISEEDFVNNKPKGVDYISLGSLNVQPLAKPLTDKATAIPNQKNFMRDSHGYHYEILGKNELGVVKGGAYSGDIVIPENITCEGKTYKVTTVRRNAFYKTADAKNIGEITSITLPASVTLIGTDAFRGNRSLRKLSYNPKARMEVRALWGCPNLEIKHNEPVYAFTDFCDSSDKSMRSKALSTFYRPTDLPDDLTASYQWAIRKHNHNGIFFGEWTNMANEDALAAYTMITEKVRGGIFYLLDEKNTETMYGTNKWTGLSVVLADNSYVATHEFLTYSRWVYGEKKVSAPAAFKQAMASKYGKKVKYCYEVGKLDNSNEKLVITEFVITNLQAQIVLSWLKNDKEVCSYTRTRDLEPDEDPNFSLWNVDDEGEYGIPDLLSVAHDERGNIELFLEHPAPESRNFFHLVQKGNKLELEGQDQWYVWY